jgi:hypothetical protein
LSIPVCDISLFEATYRDKAGKSDNDDQNRARVYLKREHNLHGKVFTSMMTPHYFVSKYSASADNPPRFLESLHSNSNPPHPPWIRLLAGVRPKFDGCRELEARECSTRLAQIY